MNPPISPTMKTIIREDDRERKAQEKIRKRAYQNAMRKADAARRHAKMDKDSTRPDRKWESHEEIQAAVEWFKENGGTITQIPAGGPLAEKLIADGTGEFPERGRHTANKPCCE